MVSYELLVEALQAMRIGHQTVRDLKGDLPRLRNFLKQLSHVYSRTFHPDVGFPSGEPFGKMVEAAAQLNDANDDQLAQVLEGFLAGTEYQLTGVKMELQILERRLQGAEAHLGDVTRKQDQEREEIRRDRVKERKGWSQAVQTLLLSVGVNSPADDYLFARQVRHYLLAGVLRSDGRTVEEEATSAVTKMKIMRWVHELNTILYYVDGQGQVFSRRSSLAFRPERLLESARQHMASTVLTRSAKKVQAQGALSTTNRWKPCGILIGSIPAQDFRLIRGLPEFLDTPLPTAQAITFLSRFVQAPILSPKRAGFSIVTLMVEIKDRTPSFTFQAFHVGGSLFKPTQLSTYVFEDPSD